MDLPKSLKLKYVQHRERAAAAIEGMDSGSSVTNRSAATSAAQEKMTQIGEIRHGHRPADAESSSPRLLRISNEIPALPLSAAVPRLANEPVIVNAALECSPAARYASWRDVRGRRPAGPPKPTDQAWELEARRGLVERS